ncbi:hypothetical protein O6H91_06G016000 [Diphasiastrum complanatum]|uniref:Uncharacterized protein n=1 Tax=Diphasiastrum complanatum TaxID=34168 RepID=A0ACC2DBG3_DIPCM|nr:hypothetical protein O6H91_06G016000 [Diphasiastrum complanatum]
MVIRLRLSKFGRMLIATPLIVSFFIDSSYIHRLWSYSALNCNGGVALPVLSVEIHAAKFEVIWNVQGTLRLDLQIYYLLCWITRSIHRVKTFNTDYDLLYESSKSICTEEF